MRPQRAQGEEDAVDAPLQESFATFFICVDAGPSSRKAEFISSSIVFYSSIMNSHSLSNASRSIGTSPRCHVKTESQFCECQKPLRGLLWRELQLLSLGRRDSHIQRGSEESVALHLKTCLCSKQRFCHEHTCLQGASFGDSAVKWGHKGRHRRTAKSSGCSSE